MLYLYVIGTREYVGEGLEKNEALPLDTVPTVMDKLMMQKEYALLEYAHVMMGPQGTGLGHMFTALLLDAKDIVSIREIPSNEEIAKAFRQSREDARKRYAAACSGITLGR